MSRVVRTEGSGAASEPAASGELSSSAAPSLTAIAGGPIELPAFSEPPLAASFASAESPELVRPVAGGRRALGGSGRIDLKIQTAGNRAAGRVGRQDPDSGCRTGSRDQRAGSRRQRAREGGPVPHNNVFLVRSAPSNEIGGSGPCTVVKRKSAVNWLTDLASASWLSAFSRAGSARTPKPGVRPRPSAPRPRRRSDRAKPGCRRRPDRPS